MHIERDAIDFVAECLLHNVVRHQPVCQELTGHPGLGRALGLVLQRQQQVGL